MNRAAWSARSALRLVALMLIETAAMRCVQAPIRECAREPSRPELLLCAPAAVASCPHASGELARQRCIVDIAVTCGPLDRLAGDPGRHVARRELPLQLCRLLHPHRQGTHDEEACPGPGERAFEGAATVVVDLVAVCNLELEPHFRFDPQPGLAVEPERDRTAACPR